MTDLACCTSVGPAGGVGLAARPATPGLRRSRTRQGGMDICRPENDRAKTENPSARHRGRGHSPVTAIGVPACTVDSPYPDWVKGTSGSLILWSENILGEPALAGEGKALPYPPTDRLSISVFWLGGAGPMAPWPPGGSSIRPIAGGGPPTPPRGGNPPRTITLPV